jgi:hypothetical protein
MQCGLVMLGWRFGKGERMETRKVVFCRIGWGKLYGMDGKTETLIDYGYIYHTINHITGLMMQFLAIFFILNAYSSLFKKFDYCQMGHLLRRTIRSFT